MLQKTQLRDKRDGGNSNGQQGSNRNERGSQPENRWKDVRQAAAIHGCMYDTNKATTATAPDIDDYVKTTRNELASQTFKQLCETGHAMMTMGIHFLVTQHLLTNKDEYAQNSRHPANLDADYKRDPTKTNMKQYLKKTMTFDTNERLTPRQNA